MARLSLSLVLRSLLLTGLAGAVLTGPGCRSSIGMADAIDESSIDESGKIPTKAFMGNPLFSHVTLSPNGQQMAVLMSRGNTDALLAINLLDGTRTPLAILERRDSSHSTANNTINRVRWASNDHVVLTAVRPLLANGVRAKRTILHSSDLRKPRLTEIGKDWGRRLQYQDRIISHLPDDPDRLLVSWYGTAQKVDLRTSGLRGVVLKKPNVSGWMADHEFKVRIGHSGKSYDTKVGVWGRVTEEDRIERLVQWDPYDAEEEGEGFFFAGFSERPEIIYVRSERETGRFAIYEYNLRTKKIGSTVFAHSKYEVGTSGVRPYWDYEIPEIWTSRVDGRLLAIYYIDDSRQIRFVDPAHRRLWQPIHDEFEGETVTVISTDEDETSSIFVVSADDSPPVYYRLDHRSAEFSRLFKALPALDGQIFSKMEPIQFQARDGLTIHGYVTRPKNAVGPTAAIVIPHDGPFARNVRGWNSRVQLLASRGFTILQLNHRGSTGYGRKFREAGYKQFGRAMQDDVTDGVRWLISEGIADPERIGIFGTGYGGYAALQGLVETPELYAAGATWGAITDLVTLVDDDALAYWGAEALNDVLIGEQWKDRAHLREVSPSQQADRIIAPVLIGHGTDDSYYHIRHADKMASALEDAGVELELYRYLGEGHSFLDERTRVGFYQRLVDFFERHLEPDPAHVRRPFGHVSAARN